MDTPLDDTTRAITIVTNPGGAPVVPPDIATATLEQYIIDARAKVEPTASALEAEAMATINGTVFAAQVRQLGGRIVLLGMWRIFHKEHYKTAGYGSFIDWVRDQFGGYEGNAYYQELGLITVRVLAKVQAMVEAGHPILAVDGSIITPESLMAQKGAMFKLKAASDAVDQAYLSGQTANGDQMIKLIHSGKREEVAKLRKTIANAGTPITPAKIPAYIKINADGTHDMTLMGLSAVDLEFIQSMIGLRLKVSLINDSGSEDDEPVMGLNDLKVVAQRLLFVFSEKEDSSWTIAALKQFGRLPKGALSHVAFMTKMCIYDELRYRLYSFFWGRTISSSGELTYAEAQATNRIAHHPSFTYYIPYLENALDDITSL